MLFSAGKALWSDEQVTTVREALPRGCTLDEPEEMAWSMELDPAGIGQYVKRPRLCSAH
jgi:hypothetical protein